MIYRMRNIVSHSESDDVPLPTCMYRLKNINIFDRDDTNEHSHEPDLKIKEQVIKFLKIPCKKMTELEKRQDHLLQQLDILYEQIKSLSYLCKDCPKEPAPTALPVPQQFKKPQLEPPAEIVINASADHLPYFLLMLAKGPLKNKIVLTYHIHSTVTAVSVTKIKEFMKWVNLNEISGSVNVKLIFKEVAANTELKLALCGVPIVGEVNILRYLAAVFPEAVPYEESFLVDSLLDECYLLQRSQRADTSVQWLFSYYKGDWILGKQLSIVDIAAFSFIKQMEATTPKLLRSVPKQWLEKASQLLN